jgi:hypothetical protein
MWSGDLAVCLLRLLKRRTTTVSHRLEADGFWLRWRRRREFFVVEGAWGLWREKKGRVLTVSVLLSAVRIVAAMLQLAL